MCLLMSVLVCTGAQDMSVMLDCRHKNVSCLPPPMAYDSLKKLLDEALITKNYSQALRYTYTYMQHYKFTCLTHVHVLYVYEMSAIVCSFLKALFSRPSLLNSSFLARYTCTCTCTCNLYCACKPLGDRRCKL